MSFSSLAFQRGIISLTAIFLVSACSENGREAPLSKVETIDIPVADINNQVNQNIDNPTLEVPETYPVADGDLLTLVWSDEFNGAMLDPETWFFETGDGSQYGFGQGNVTPGWGNNELQYYLPDNAQLEGGVLKITAKRERAEDYNFTSARINTQDRFAFKYGRIEASIKFPSGQGLWPAFWMLSQDSPYGEWAQTGEIDVVEAVNLDGTGGNEIFATIHFGGDASLGQNLSAETLYTPSFDVTEDFHTYAFEWDEFEMRWYVDGTLYKVENSWSSTAAPYPAPFDQPFHILFNLAVGGNFPGSPDGTTPSPATMEVDWVRVYSGEAPPVTPADPGIIPDVKLYDRGGNPDLVFGVDYGNIVTFTSGAGLEDNYTGDADFSPAISVTTGFGYGKWNAQLAYVEFAAGFATGYETLDFKVKGLSGDVIRVKFLDSPDYLDINVVSSAYSTALGNGWYQVSAPIADFSAVATATGLLFETIEPAPAASFRYLLTDIGFSGTAGGGGGATGLGVFSETNKDPFVNITNIVSAGNPVLIDTASTAVTPFDGAVSLELIYSDNTANNFYGGAIFEFSDEDLSAYDTLKFSIDTSAFAGFVNLTVQLEPPAGGTPGGNVSLAGYTPVTSTGNWDTYEIPLGDFTAVNLSLVNRLGFFNARDGSDVLLAGTLYLDDIHFTTVGGNTGGGGDGNFVNGDFETGDFTGWTLTQVPAGRGSITLDTSGQGGRAGNVARLVANGDATGTNDVLISQVALAAGTVMPGDSIDVSFDLYGSLTGAGGVVFVEVIFLNGAGQDVGGRNFVGPPAPYTPTTTWTTHSGTVIAGTAVDGSQFDVSGGVTLQLKAACGAIPEGCGVDASLDNVTFTIN